jgi:hypothetical protein
MCDIAAKPSWESCRLLVEADSSQFKAGLAPPETGEVRVCDCISTGWRPARHHPQLRCLAEAHRLNNGVDVERPGPLGVKTGRLDTAANRAPVYYSDRGKCGERSVRCRTLKLRRRRDIITKQVRVKQ